MPNSKNDHHVDQPRRSLRTSLPPMRYEDTYKIIRKNSTRSKVKKLSKTKTKTKTKTKPKSQKNKLKKLNFFGSNSSDDSSVKLVLADRPPQYTHKPLEGPINRKYKSIGQRLTVGSRNLNTFQLANMRSRQKKEYDVIIREMNALADEFSYLKTPGF